MINNRHLNAIISKKSAYKILVKICSDLFLKGWIVTKEII